MRLCGFEVGLDRPVFLIAGPCAIESRELAMETAGRLKEITGALGVPFVYKSSFDKANRSSGASFRGPGLDGGLRILDDVRREIGVPVLTDVHDIDQIGPVAAVVDVLQTPAFLCRQTDFIRAVAASGKPCNIKKGQFLAPHDMKNVAEKARRAAIEAGHDGDSIMVCERGASFGYNNLVSDMRSLAISCRAGRARARAASASSCRCSRARRSPPASRGSSWRRTRTRRRRCPTARTPGRCRGWPSCSRRWSSSTRWSSARASQNCRWPVERPPHRPRPRTPPCPSPM
jgi:2-dehydro-3-deoxyphosphooctonate aldolase (KDO 8-P synthase)